LAARTDQQIAEAAAARRAEVEGALPAQRPEVLGTQLEGLAKAKETAASNAVRAKFNEVREAGANVRGLPVQNLVNEGKTILSDTIFAPGEAPEVARVLARMQPKPAEAPSAAASGYASSLRAGNGTSGANCHGELAGCDRFTRSHQQRHSRGKRHGQRKS